MALTINSSSTAYASVTQMVNRYDVRTLGDLLSDNDVRLSPSQVTGSGVLADLLLGASGRLEIACLAGQRYDPTSLQNLAASSTAAASYLANLVCDLCFDTILSRRPLLQIQVPRQVTEALATLELLRGGQRVLGFLEAQEAGVIVERVVDNECLVSCIAARMLGPCNVCCGPTYGGCGCSGGPCGCE